MLPSPAQPGLHSAGAINCSQCYQPDTPHTLKRDARGAWRGEAWRGVAHSSRRTGSVPITFPMRIGMRATRGRVAECAVGHPAARSSRASRENHSTIAVQTLLAGPWDVGRTYHTETGDPSHSLKRGIPLLQLHSRGRNILWLPLLAPRLARGRATCINIGPYFCKNSSSLCRLSTAGRGGARRGVLTYWRYPAAAPPRAAGPLALTFPPYFLKSCIFRIGRASCLDGLGFISTNHFRPAAGER